MATDKPSYPSDAAEKFIIRLSTGMREKISEAAKSNNRSMNAEVLARLDTSFDSVDGYVTKEQFERTLRDALFTFEAEQFTATTVRAMLANNVVRLFELLPEDRRTEALTNAYEFARALRAPGAVGLEAASAKILQRSEDAEEPRTLAKTLRRQESRLQDQIQAKRVGDVSLDHKTDKPRT